jgi:hypothetical protein
MFIVQTQEPQLEASLSYVNTGTIKCIVTYLLKAKAHY